MPVAVSGNDVNVDGFIVRVREVCGMTGNLNNSSKVHRKVYDVWAKDGSFPPIAACYSAVSAFAPATFDNLALNAIDYREDPGTDHFEFTLTYDSTPPESTLRWSGDSTGGTVKLTTSYGTNRYALAGRTAPDFKSAIGVKQTDRHVEPEGVDIIIPALKLTATYKWPKNTFGLAQAKLLAALTGRTNDALWQTFAAGELLFAGATFEIIPNIPTDVQYNFIASENAIGLSIGDITGVAKKGHDYLWVLFEADQDTAAKKLVQRPLAVYVEKAYRDMDFVAQLGIPAA